MEYTRIELPETGLGRPTKPTFKADPNESPVLTGLRGAGRAGAELVQQAVGLPRAVGELAQSAGNLLASASNPVGYGSVNKPFGESIPFLPSKQTAKEYITDPIAQALTGQQGTLEPQSEREAFADEVISDALPFLFSTGPASLVGKAARGLGISGAGKVAKFASQKLGFGKGAQELVNVGSMAALSLIGKPGAKVYAQNLYDEGNLGVPTSSVTEYRPIKTTIKDIKSNFLDIGDRKSPTKVYFRNFIDEIERKSNHPAGTIGVRELLQFKKDYNSNYDKIPNIVRPYAKKLFESFDKAVIEHAPESVAEAYKKSLRADNVYSAISAQNGIEKFIEKNPKLSALLGSGSGAGIALAFAANPGPTTAAGAILGSVIGGGSFLKKLYKYPEMQTYYKNLLKSLAKEDVGASLKYATKLGGYLKDSNSPQLSEDQYEVISL